MEAIAEAALAIGLDKVTMTAVAERLGVDHSSLYRHVGNRAELLVVAADLAMAGLDLQSDAPHWRGYLEVLAGALWSLYRRHPGLADILRTMEMTPPSAVRAFAEVVRRLESFGFTRPNAVLVLDSIVDMTTDSVSGWRRLARRGRAGKRVGDSIVASWTAAAREAGGTLAPQIDEFAAVLTGDPETWWRRKLGLLLDGAEVLLARQTR